MSDGADANGVYSDQLQHYFEHSQWVYQRTAFLRKLAGNDRSMQELVRRWAHFAELLVARSYDSARWTRNLADQTFSDRPPEIAQSARKRCRKLRMIADREVEECSEKLPSLQCEIDLHVKRKLGESLRWQHLRIRSI